MMDEKGHLDNTIVYLYSDHGDHLNFLTLKTQSGQGERMNPAMFVMLPEDLDEEVGKVVGKNS
jgi:arylsulfatase A-like enzyme